MQTRDAAADDIFKPPFRIITQILRITHIQAETHIKPGINIQATLLIEKNDHDKMPWLITTGHPSTFSLQCFF